MATQAVRLPRSSGSGQTTAKRFSPADIQTSGGDLPNRYVLHGVEGFGKTSLAAQAPKPIFLQSRGETGLETLIRSGQLTETPHFPELQSWEDIRAAVQYLREEQHTYRTAVIDTGNGAERLMHEFICTRDFGGDWGERGFAGYGRGYEVSMAEWRMFLGDLDALRKEKKMTIFILLHTKVKTFKNPEGSDYDRYMPDVHEKTWSLTHKWADCVLFGNFETTVKTEGRASDPTKKGKGLDGTVRVVYTERRAAWDAKNRLGLPEDIEMGSSPQEEWAHLMAAIKAGKAPVPPPAPNDTAKTEVTNNG